MGTAGKTCAMTLDIEPGDQKAQVVLHVPEGFPLPTKAKVTVQREGQAPIEGELEVKEVAA